MVDLNNKVKIRGEIIFKPDTDVLGIFNYLNLLDHFCPKYNLDMDINVNTLKFWGEDLYYSEEHLKHLYEKLNKYDDEILLGSVKFLDNEWKTWEHYYGGGGIWKKAEGVIKYQEHNSINLIEANSEEDKDFEI